MAIRCFDKKNKNRYVAIDARPTINGLILLTRSPAVAGMGRPFRDVDLTVSIGLIEETRT